MPRAEVSIERWECRFLRSYSGGWLLVYGRRKTGKTWLLRRCLGWSLYVTVGRAGECIVSGRDSGHSIVGLGECVDMVSRELKNGESLVVVDEFQRLPEKYWSLLSSIHGESEGLLVACGSSMGIARRVFDRRSPLLGLFQALRVDVASVADTIASLAEHGLGAREAVLWAVVARDPWILAHLEPRGEPWRALAAVAPRLAMVARGLVGEVFEEEDRMLTRVYDATLHLLAQGVWRAAEIAQRLYSLGLISSPQPGSATGLLKVLEEMGLVERIPLWRTRGARIYYRHRSSLLALLYSVQDIAVELGEPPGPDWVRARYGVEVQFNLGELLALIHGLRRGYSMPHGSPDIDILLLDRRGRPQRAYEVKIGSLGEREAREAVERLRSHGIPAVGLVSLAERPPPLGDEALGPEDIVEAATRASRVLRERAEEEARTQV